MKIISTEDYEGRPYKVLGVVFGTSTRASNLLKDKLSGFRDIFGGRSTAYKQVLEGSMHDLGEEISKSARDLGADAVVGFRVTSTAIGGSKMIAFQGYGTAIRFTDT